MHEIHDYWKCKSYHSISTKIAVVPDAANLTRPSLAHEPLLVEGCWADDQVDEASEFLPLIVEVPSVGEWKEYQNIGSGLGHLTEWRLLAAGPCQVSHQRLGCHHLPLARQGSQPVSAPDSQSSDGAVQVITKTGKGHIAAACQCQGCL